jgi:hypothetical protein
VTVNDHFIFQLSTDDSWTTMMGMQEEGTLSRAQVRAKVPDFDSIFRPKRQAYPSYCICEPIKPMCPDGPAGPAGPAGQDGRKNEVKYFIYSEQYCIFLQNPAVVAHPDNLDNLTPDHLSLVLQVAVPLKIFKEW